MNLVKQQDLEKRTKIEIDKMIIQAQKSFNGIKRVWSKGIEDMEKIVKTVRRRRRRLKAKHIARLKKEELDLEDIMSSSSDTPEKNDKSRVEGSMVKSGEGLNLPRSTLEGAPILEKGEPFGCTVAEEWVSEYGGTSTVNNKEFLNYAENHEDYKKARDTTERNVNYLFILAYNPNDICRMEGYEAQRRKQRKYKAFHWFTRTFTYKKTNTSLSSRKE